MSSTKGLTEEEKKERQRELGRLRAEKYRLKHRDPSLGRKRAKANEQVTTEIKNNVIIHRIEPKTWIPETTVRLTRDSSQEEMLAWCMEVVEQLRNNPNPAAWVGALNAVWKVYEFLDKKLPPVMPEVKPRPRQTIVIEEEQEVDDE